MSLVEMPLLLEKHDTDSKDLEILKSAEEKRILIEKSVGEEKYMDALEQVVDALKSLRDYSNTDDTELQAILVALLFDLSEIHFLLKDYKQSEKELDTIFRILESLIKTDSERFAKYHILAMELSTRILRSRKKTLDLLVKQQINAGNLYEKVNAGVSAATDKLVDSLRNVGQLLASTGDYRAAMKFYAEAIKISKKRAGRVTRKELKMTLEMATIMNHVRQMKPRAKRLLNAILPHAVALETIEIEEDILALLEIIDNDLEQEPKWKNFLHKLSIPIRKGKKDSTKNQNPS